MKHGLVRLDNVWGMGGGMRPVKYLVKKIQMLLKEYLCSGDVNEAIRCLQELEVPHFHHELVYEAVVMVIEDMGDMAMELMCKLLKTLDRSVIVTPEQMKRGFDRVFQEMPDICIDVPAAYTVLEKFVTKCTGTGFLSAEIAKAMPTRQVEPFERPAGRLVLMPLIFIFQGPQAFCVRGRRWTPQRGRLLKHPGPAAAVYNPLWSFFFSACCTASI